MPSKLAILPDLGPQEDADKILFLAELETTRADPTDKNNAAINRRSMARFRRLVDILELRDIHLHVEQRAH